jgi:hypothetical protein
MKANASIAPDCEQVKDNAAEPVAGKGKHFRRFSNWPKLQGS